jgi:surface polysaccharide O-acyltransferase-like enzyme
MGTDHGQSAAPPETEAERAAPAARRHARLPELDTLRALACAAFVAWHVLQHVAQGAPVGQRAGWLALSQFFVLGGPVFFYLSALLCFHRHPAAEPEGAERGWLREYWGRRLLIVVVPYVTWSAIYLLLEAPRYQGLSGGEVLGAAATAVFLGVGHLGFVNALLAFYLLFPFLRWLEGRADRWALGVSALLLGAAWMLGGRAYLPADLPPGVSFPLASGLLGWLPYVALGAASAPHLGDLHRIAPRPAGVWAALLLGASAVAVGYYALGPARALGPLPYAGAMRPEVLIAAVAWLPFLLYFAWRTRGGVLGSLCREAAPWTPAVFFVHLLPLKLAAALTPDTWPNIGAGWPVVLVYGSATALGTLGLLRLLARSPAALLMAGVVPRPRRAAPAAAAREAEEPLRIAAGW